MKFRGSTSINLDSKNRLSIPTKYRQALADACDGEVIITAHPHGCLLLYPSPTWSPVEDDLMARTSLDPDVSSIADLLVGMAEDLSVDATGRVLLSSELREFAGIEKEVMLVGQINHFKIWNKATWTEKTASLKPVAGQKFEMPEALADFRLLK